VTRLQRPEMPALQGSQFRLAEAFDHREYRGIDEAHVAVGIAVHDLANGTIVLGMQVLDLLRTGVHVIQQRHEHVRMQANVDPVVYLHQHQSRNDQGFVSGGGGRKDRESVPDLIRRGGGRRPP
jgi:hypothetical protein